MNTSKKEIFSERNIITLFFLVLIFINISFDNYLLFHSLVELFSIIIAFNIFIIAFNTLQISQNDYFVFLGITYAFVGGFDLLHVLSFTYSLITVILLLSIFYWGIFPDCFVKGLGLTLFKKISEYLISIILIAVIILLKNNRDDLNNTSYRLINFAIIATIISEISFTFYINIYGLSNMLGHIFKLISFYLIYKAMNETSLKKPYTLLFNKLTETNHKLKRERNKLAQYFELAGVMIINVDENGKISEVNKKSCEVLDFSKKELIGQDWRNFVDESEEKKLTEAFASTPSDQSSLLNYGQNEIISRNGDRRKVLWNSNVEKDKKGNIKRILNSGMDITQYELLKEELEYNKLQVEIFANLSHELKTPLNLIFSALEVLNVYQKKYLEVENYRKSKKYIAIIRKNSHRLLRLVNNLIDITKINSNSFDLHLRNRDIVAVVREIIYSVADYIEKKERVLEFNSNIEKKVIACDPFSIERIILNLLSNAIKFSKTGDKISVNLFAEEDIVLISVKDTGIGIPKDKQAVIFERFRQIDKSFARNSEGSGIGLTIVKLLVELHNGKITVYSKYGKFTEFKIKIPVKKLSDRDSSEFDNRSNISNLMDKIEVEFSDIYDL